MTIADIKSKHDLLTLFVAVIAVLLSQFPPVYQWFYTPIFDIAENEAFVIKPDARSGLTVGKYFSVTNTGEEAGRIKSILLFITDSNDNLLYESKAKNFMHSKSGAYSKPLWENFTEINLKPNENWSHSVTYYKQLKSHELEDIHIIQNQVEHEREQWEEEMEDKGIDLRDYDAVIPEFKISKELLEKLKETVKNKLKWFAEGDYFLYEASVTNDGEKIKKYTFNINKRHLSTLAESLSNFEYGVVPNMIPNVIFDLNMTNHKTPKLIVENIRKYNK